MCWSRERARSSDNEGIRQDRGGIARKAQEEKSSGRENFVAPRTFFLLPSIRTMLRLETTSSEEKLDSCFSGV